MSKSSVFKKWRMPVWNLHSCVDRSKTKVPGSPHPSRALMKTCPLDFTCFLLFHLVNITYKWCKHKENYQSPKWERQEESNFQLTEWGVWEGGLYASLTPRQHNFVPGFQWPETLKRRTRTQKTVDVQKRGSSAAIVQAIWPTQFSD